MAKKVKLAAYRLPGVFIGLWVLYTLIFFARYPFAYSVPNFYAEDGKVFIANILQFGPIEATTQLFNGYLVVGQYLVANVAMFINFIAGNEFVTLPKAIALASYLFLGLLCCLPWVLFRKKVGSTTSIVAGILIALTPLGSSDWTVIGTIGNLKFAFFYIGFMLIIYRNLIISTHVSKNKVYVIDGIVLLCILTNIVTVVLLPIAVAPYLSTLMLFMRKRSYKELLRMPGLMSVVAVGAISFLYICAVYVKGIPTMPGYLDGPLSESGLINAVYRGSLYGFFYPLQSTLTTFLTASILVISMAIALLSKSRWNGYIVVVSAYAIVWNVVGFALNRPGVTEYYINPPEDGGPGQFFYAGTMIFIVAVMFLLAPYVRTVSSKRARVSAGMLLLLYGVWAVPHAGYRERSLADYSSVPPIAVARAHVCEQAEQGRNVKIAIYPSKEWYMQADRDFVCAR